MLAIDDVNEREIVIDQAGRIGDLENLAVNARLGIGTFELFALRSLAVGAGPFVLRDLARRRPRFAAVEDDLLAQRNEMMRPGDGDQFWLPLLKIGFPEKRVAIDDAPFARRLLAADVEVQMRPAAAAA